MVASPEVRNAMHRASCVIVPNRTSLSLHATLLSLCHNESFSCLTIVLFSKSTIFPRHYDPPCFCTPYWGIIFALLIYWRFASSVFLSASIQVTLVWNLLTRTHRILPTSLTLSHPPLFPMRYTSAFYVHRSRAHVRNSC